MSWETAAGLLGSVLVQEEMEDLDGSYASGRNPCPKLRKGETPLESNQLNLVGHLPLEFLRAGSRVALAHASMNASPSGGLKCIFLPTVSANKRLKMNGSVQ